MIAPNINLVRINGKIIKMAGVGGVQVSNLQSAIITWNRSAYGDFTDK